MTVWNHLVALGEIVSDKQFVDNLLNVDWELSYLRPMLVHAPMDDIAVGLTDDYSYHHQDRQPQNQPSNAGRGCFQRQNPQGQGAAAAAAGLLAMAGVNAVSGGEVRACYNCGKHGHLRECSELLIEVCNYLKKQAAARGCGRGRARGRGRGGPGAAAISVAEV